MGRFTLALGYVLTGDERYLWEYQHSFNQRPIQPEMVALLNKLNAGGLTATSQALVRTTDMSQASSEDLSK